MVDKTEDLLGKVPKKITVEDDRLQIYFDDGIATWYHEQHCCEKVYIADVNGDTENLIGSPLLMSEESSSVARHDEDVRSIWTFYRFATVNGYVDIRWIGTSNGYYSERVDFNWKPVEPA